MNIEGLLAENRKFKFDLKVKRGLLKEYKAIIKALRAELKINALQKRSHDVKYRKKRIRRR